jgi:hypothetical protein
VLLLRKILSVRRALRRPPPERHRLELPADDLVCGLVVELELGELQASSSLVESLRWATGPRLQELHKVQLRRVNAPATDRGKPFHPVFAPLATVTVHPSSILREPDRQARHRARRELARDLADVARLVED